MTIKNLLNAVVSELQGATTTHLAAAKVYKGYQDAWRAQKCILVMWSGGTEEPAAIQDSFYDLHNIIVQVRMPVRDSTGAVGDGDWYDDFLELSEEVKVELTILANRFIRDAASEDAVIMRIDNWGAGFTGEADEQMMVCEYSLTYTVDQP